MRLTFFTGLLIFVAIAGCGTSASKKAKATGNSELKIDSSKSFTVGGMWITPKPSIEYDTLGKSGADTLNLVVCSDFVYSPFGTIKNKSKFKSSLLKNFDLVDRTDTIDIGPIKFQILKHHFSKLIFYFDNDPEASRHSNILKGEIYDQDVKFANGVKIGMSLANFYNAFFLKFPSELTNMYKVMVLTSCVDDIKHIYTFENGQLTSVKFISDTYWKVNY